MKDMVSVLTCMTGFAFLALLYPYDGAPIKQCHLCTCPQEAVLHKCTCKLEEHCNSVNRYNFPSLSTGIPTYSSTEMSEEINKIESVTFIQARGKICLIEWFEELQKLEIESSDISEIDEISFRNAERLYSLSIQNSLVHNYVHDNADMLHLNTLVLVNSCSGIDIHLLLTNKPNLEHLLLEKCNLTKIDHKMFDGNPGLEDIYLKNNNLKTIDEGSFDKLLSLKSLDLKGNPITYVRFNVEKLSTMKHVFLEENCDLCEIRILHNQCPKYKCSPNSVEYIPKSKSLQDIIECLLGGGLTSTTSWTSNNEKITNDSELITSTTGSSTEHENDGDKHVVLYIFIIIALIIPYFGIAICLLRNYYKKRSGENRRPISQSAEEQSECSSQSLINMEPEKNMGTKK